MNIDKAAGIDNPSGKFLKDGTNILGKSISEMCNFSIKHSLFPIDCQISKLKPLSKKGSTKISKNYRPISLLLLISKIIEKVIILYRFQSGFRKNFSTDLCLSCLNNKFTTGFESGLYTDMILIDLQKVFDAINYEILINKMNFLGFSKDIIL